MIPYMSITMNSILFSSHTKRMVDVFPSQAIAEASYIAIFGTRTRFVVMVRLERDFSEEKSELEN
ncbi:hypothetical protein DICVIV_02404 [Dictyocaulus viviparus]|uniref:Uncharacterized protein n=1 Tax=Dictyocaulus viviparus TaxID=29172 RepID=A0A0D8Y3U7_DICVI|nr:hypothetical protein DICVIV_02404 [Dictyocaulus viviparus]